ncbi:unnamed protein product [Cunninghamella echinulata]
MGAQSSKQVTRKLPKTARPETLASTPRYSPSTLQSLQNQTEIEFKEDDLMKIKKKQILSCWKILPK